MGSTSSIFMGTSRYSSDFSQVIQRAVSIASLPLTQLQQQKAQLSDESTALTGIDSKVAALQTALQAIDAETGSGMYTSALSNDSVAGITLDDAAVSGNYTLNVTKLGAYTTALSGSGLTTVTDPDSTSISAASSFHLTTGGTTYTITPAANTLNALAEAINSTTGGGVHATVINVGGSGAPDYRLSLQANQLSSSPISLSDGSDLSTVISNTEVQSSNSLPTVSDPTKQNIGSSNTFTLNVNGTAYNLQATTLNGLRDAINSAGISGISASVVDAGGGDYRLSISRPDQNTSISLNQSLTDTVVTGSPAQYTINGSNAITSNSRTVLLAPGVTATLTGTGPTDIIVSQDDSALSSKLTDFVSAFNAVVTTLASNRGQSGSALNGNPIIPTLQQWIRNVANYTGSGAVSNLAEMGIGFDASHTGMLTLDPSVLAKAKPADVLSFLGSIGGRTGFLASANSLMNGLEDPITGLVKTSLTDLSTHMREQDDKIADMNNRISDLQIRLTNQMAKADALIAQMEQQVTYYTSLFKSMSGNSNNGN